MCINLLNKEDQKLRDLIKNTYKSFTVGYRGSISIDPQEVSMSEEFKEALIKASELIK